MGFYTQFWQSVEAVLEDVFVVEKLLNYYFSGYLSLLQNYGSPTRVIGIKDAPNVVDPISVKDTDNGLKPIKKEIDKIPYCLMSL